MVSKAVAPLSREVDPEAAQQARARYACFDHFGEDERLSSKLLAGLIGSSDAWAGRRRAGRPAITSGDDGAREVPGGQC